MSYSVFKLQWVLDLPNYQNSLKGWFDYRGINDQKQKDHIFDRYLKVVKPVIHYYHRALELDSLKFALLTNLRPDQIQTLFQFYQDLKKFKVVTQHQVAQQGHNVLTKEQFEELLREAPKPIYLVPLNEDPTNAELPYWGSYIPVECQSFTSVVIHGKGLAAKDLGFPTANLASNQQVALALKDLPNGIYLVDFAIQGHPVRQGVLSLGFNPHYQDLKDKRVLQVYVFYNYDQSFYDARVRVSIKLLMRTEGKFASFDAFLQAMHNDICTGRRLASQVMVWR